MQFIEETRRQVLKSACRRQAARMTGYWRERCARRCEPVGHSQRRPELYRRYAREDEGPALKVTKDRKCQ